MLPVRWQVLSGSWLKVIAMASMLVDHTAGQLLRHYPAFTEPLVMLGNNHALTWYFLLRSVGRLAFPIFCFLIVEGFLHTHDRWKYGRNLFVFALISEIPFNLAHGGHLYGWGQNVFFTLFLGYLALCVVHRWEEGRASRSWLATRLFAIIVLGIFIRADYGSCGISFILLMYLLRHHHIFRAAIGCVILPMRWIAGLAFIPIAMYNGRRGFIQGPIAKYLFYAFYPAHLLVLYFIRRILEI